MAVCNSIIQDETILTYYKEGKDIRDDDVEIVNELSSIGLMKKGISLKRKVVTAKTSTLGLKLIS
jgi:hypothetical protein